MALPVAALPQEGVSYNLTFLVILTDGLAISTVIQIRTD